MGNENGQKPKYGQACKLKGLSLYDLETLPGRGHPGELIYRPMGGGYLRPVTGSAAKFLVDSVLTGSAIKMEFGG
jgi:hypothetical protein